MWPKYWSFSFSIGGNGKPLQYSPLEDGEGSPHTDVFSAVCKHWGAGDGQP